MINTKKVAGHKFLAGLGKTRLRPGGKQATEWLFKQAGFTPQSQVLEIACNMATTSIEIAKIFVCHIIGIDVDKSALEKAKQNTQKTMSISWWTYNKQTLPNYLLPIIVLISS